MDRFLLWWIKDNLFDTSREFAVSSISDQDTDALHSSSLDSEFSDEGILPLGFTSTFIKPQFPRSAANLKLSTLPIHKISDPVNDNPVACMGLTTPQNWALRKAPKSLKYTTAYMYVQGTPYPATSDFPLL